MIAGALALLVGCGQDDGAKAGAGARRWWLQAAHRDPREAFPDQAEAGSWSQPQGRVERALRSRRAAS